MAGTVSKGDLLDLTRIFPGDKAQDLRLKSILFPGEAAVAQSVTTFIKVQRGFRGLPARIPDRITFFDIKIMSVIVIGNTVVPITGDAEKLCIFIEAVTAAGIRDQTEKAIRSQIIDPRKGCIRALNDIFHRSVVKKSIFHSENPPDYCTSVENDLEKEAENNQSLCIKKSSVLLITSRL